MKGLGILAAASLVISALMRQPVLKDTETADVHKGTRTAVTTANMWISDDSRNNRWVVDVEGTPQDVYIVDTPARQEISHYETIHHDAVTHQEPVSVSTPVWYVDFPDAFGTTYRETYYDYESALAQAGVRDGNIITGTQTTTSYITVIDQAAYDETIRVVDQYAQAERGHTETQIVGEQGHWEQGNEDTVGIGRGYYVSKMSREEN
ncbi:MAG: hypothetical protein IKD69_12930 [Solobacterium sp.]|nr:hypothetical protein [Solobacterium sp.]